MELSSLLALPLPMLPLRGQTATNTGIFTYLPASQPRTNAVIQVTCTGNSADFLFLKQFR